MADRHNSVLCRHLVLRLELRAGIQGFSGIKYIVASLHFPECLIRTGNAALSLDGPHTYFTIGELLCDKELDHSHAALRSVSSIHIGKAQIRNVLIPTAPLIDSLGFRNGR